MYREFLLPVLGVLLLLHSSSPTERNSNPLVLFISFDGFRYDYLKMMRDSGRSTPNFDRLRKNGVEAEFVKNVFPTATFPNHFSLVTGHYAESHGVIGNKFYDFDFNETFAYWWSNSTKPHFWNNGTSPGSAEPIWVTNQKAASGQTGSTGTGSRNSAVLYWPGAGVEMHGTQATIWEPYDEQLPDKLRVDKMIEVLTKKENPVNLWVLYFPQPDLWGHHLGPNSDELLDNILGLDQTVGYLISELEKVNLMEDMNIVITSDHGMTQLEEQPYIELENFIDSSLYQLTGEGYAYHITPHQGHFDDVYEALSKIPHVKAYKKEEIPRELYYSWNRRIQPIVVIADEGYSMVQSLQKEEHSKEKHIGGHGFSSSLTSMHPFFIAHGPAFKKNFVSKSFNSVDIYPLLCNILDITPFPNNGSLSNIQHILRDDTEKAPLSITIVIIFTVALLGALVSGIFCLAAMRSDPSRQRRQLVVKLSSNLGNGDNRHLLRGDTEEEEEEEDEIP